MFCWLVNWLTDLQTNCKGQSPSVQGWSVTMSLLLRPTPRNKGRRVSYVKDLEIQIKWSKLSQTHLALYLLWCDITNYKQIFKKIISTWLGTLVGFRLSSRLNMCRHGHLNTCWNTYSAVCSLQQNISLGRFVAVSTAELHLTRGDFPPGLGLYRLALREIFSCMDTLIMLAAL